MIRVLMVDDDPVILDLTTVFLERSGDITIDTVQSPPKAMEKLELASYDVIISDYRMPEMDGITFLKTVRARGLDIPFILFTGRGREEVVIEALNNGADYYLQKDSDPEVLFTELSHQVRQAVERKRAEKALQESEERYRTFVRNVHGIAFRWNLDRTLLFLHGTVKEITGYAEEDLIAGTLQWVDIIHPDDRAQREDKFERSHSVPNYSATHTYRIVRKDGEVRWIHEAVHNICDESGNSLGVEGTLHDITDRVRSHEQILAQRDLGLRLSEITSLEEALELCVKTAIKVSGMDCGSVYLVNMEQNNLELGYTTGLSREFIDAVSGSKRDLKKLRSDRSARPVYISYQDKSLPRQSAREREGIRAMAVVPIFHAEQAMGYYSVGSHTVDEVPSYNRDALETVAAMTGNAVARIQTTEAIDETKKEIRTLFSSLQDFLFVLDLEGRILSVNGAVEPRLGYALDELLGRYVFELHHPDQRDEAMAVFAEVTVGKTVLSTIPLQAKDGTLISVESKIKQGRWDDRDVFFGISRDVTQRKEAEEEIRRAHKQLLDIIEFLPDATFVIDQDRRVISWNRAIEEMTGVRKEDVLGKGDYAYAEPFYGTKRPILIDLVFLGNEDIESLYDHLKRTGNTIFAETFTPYMDGGRGRYLWGTASPLFDSEGNLVGAIESIRDVSELRQAEASLRQSRERYRRLIDLSPEAIGVHCEGGFVYMNPVGIELLGAEDLEELKSRSLMEYLHLDSRHQAKERIQRCYEGKTRAGFDEAKLIRLNGQVLDIEIATAPIIDDKKPAALVVIRDITDRKHAEERIRENEERLRVIFEAAENVSFIITDARDPEPFIIEFSPGAEKIFGYGREEMIGTIVSRLHIPEDIAKFPEMHRLMREGCMGFSGVTTLVRRSGERFPALFTTYSLLDEEGNMYAALGVSVDLTEQKKAEDALRESEERLNLAIEGGNLGTWDWNLITGEVIRSSRFADMLGYSPEELEGHVGTWEQLVHPEDLPQVNEVIQDHIRGKKPYYEMEYRLRCKDGHWAWMRGRGVAVAEDESGRPTRMTGTIQDITEMRRYQDALKEANKKLNLLSSVTRHDILNQVMGLSGYAQLLSEVLPQDPAMEQYISRIMELAGTIRRQIVFTRDYQDMGVKSPEWQHMETVVRRATTTTPFEHIRFRVSTGSLEIFADPMLEKAIFNLMENSKRHGKTATEVRISFHEVGGRGIIVFEDNGVGVPPESKGQIFEWAHGKNTGFGLFLVREILSITGMTIRETGEAGKGARFEIEVPKEHYRMARDLG